ncbi:MAG TPA: hypothetical protein VF859_04860, partial [Burkholderiales bacterium]
GTPLPYAKAPAAPDAGSLDYVERIVRFCREHHIDLRIYTTPSHARNLEISALAGSWPRLEDGKRRLVEILGRDAAAHPGQPEITWHDFADYSSITTEALPSGSGTDEMRNYWDSSHFKERVGDLVLDRVLGHGIPGRELPPDFGLRVTASSVEAHLAGVRQRQAAYRASRGEDVAALRALLAQAGGRPD